MKGVFDLGNDNKFSTTHTDGDNNQTQKKTSWEISQQSILLAKQAKREYEKDGKVTVCLLNKSAAADD